MSRPRRPFGADQPGRLQATMLKVLAAEMCDPARFARGKRLRADDAVVDVVIGHGAVTALVQGSRPEPYVVTLLTRPGRSVPSRKEVTVRCTCPDDDGVGGTACKHGVAAMFAFADEVSLDADSLARWRQSDMFEAGAAGEGDADADVADAQPAEPLPVDPLIAEIAALLLPPDGERLPMVPELSTLEPADIPDRVVADVVADAMAHLRVRWD